MTNSFQEEVHAAFSAPRALLVAFTEQKMGVQVTGLERVTQGYVNEVYVADLASSEFLNSFAAYGWLIAAAASFFVQRYFQSRGWTFITAGALFVVVRQFWELTPYYGAGEDSSALFNGYMMRYVFGSLGAALLSAGCLLLIANYYFVRSRLETSIK